MPITFYLLLFFYQILLISSKDVSIMHPKSIWRRHDSLHVYCPWSWTLRPGSRYVTA